MYAVARRVEIGVILGKGVTIEGCVCGEIAGGCEEDVEFKRPIRRGGDEGRTPQGATGRKLRRSLIRTGDDDLLLLTFLRVGLNSVVEAATGTVDMLATILDVSETLSDEEVGSDRETEEAGTRPDFRSL